MFKIDLKLIVIGVLLLWIIFLKECSPKIKCPDIKKGTTVITKTHYDTIPFYDTTKVRIPIYVNVPVGNPITEIPNPLDSSIVREYRNKFEDSLLIGEMYVKVDGTLIANNFNYLPKFPKYIIRTDSVFTNTTIEELHNRLLYGGGINVGRESFGVNLGLGLKTKRDNVYLVTYDPFNKSVGFSIFNSLKKSK